MQFSESWLRSLCNPALDTDQLCHVLTMAGLEVEESRRVAAPFEHVVVARIVACEKHPDADRLRLCQVDVGTAEPLQIVCGAPNAAAGLVIPCALVGARLPGIEIRKASVRGIESSGMLCSARELGIAEDSDGLLELPADAPVGMNIREFLDLDDHLITLKLTPNRADCLSLAGLAREVSALTGAVLHLPVVAPVAPAHDDSRAVMLDAPAACSRYCGRLITGVDAAAPTPDWIRQRLDRVGIRSISAIVDVTNYVMMELGQPLHAFDNARLQGTIHVRHPHAGEELLLLNGQTVVPAADTVLIADESRALALGGVMGGENSGVTDATRDVFLESAFFAPEAIAGKARALGFSSDASYRFERGVDPGLQQTAIERATALIIEICGGSPGPVVAAISEPHLPRRAPVRLRTARAAKIIGVDLGHEKIGQLLTGLGFAPRRDGDDFIVTPPSYRFDIEIEEDLVEELVRIHGYDNIPSHPPVGRMAMMALPETRRTAMTLRRALAGRGFQETINFSFVEAGWEADFAGNTSPVTLANPIASQMGVMRSSLIGSLVNVLVTNRKRQQELVRAFEIGRVFSRDDAGHPVPGFTQPQRLAVLAAGPVAPEQWGQGTRSVDFFDLKADLEALFPPGTLSFVRTAHPALHPGRSALVQSAGGVLGIIGELHPRWALKYELGVAPVVFELDLAPLMNEPMPACREISRFPSVARDLALIVDHALPWQDLASALREAAPPIVTAIELFDVYAGKGIAEGRKSLAFKVVMQDTRRTLEDAEVENVVAAMLAAAEARFGAELRR
ncbi:MAG: phenylalanine--tRNA ligase subunit beta [Proteobacteria bacterium]|nr:phenylalanine--tRNA ligase subunit beta [Pseudomonadota bacterium]HQR04046.1 phenylalanine--tRNA ligase subunit beta [Rhodocyclaceae bacterium]